MDLRTLLIAQTCALGATAVMLWIARSDTDRRNGLRTWMLAVTSQAIAYLLLANAGRLPVLASALLGNLLGALSVALFFVAIRQFLGMAYSVVRLAAMVGLVTVVATAAGSEYVGATIFNGFAYGVMELLNGRALWRSPPAGLARVQRLVAGACLAMGTLLPARALALALARSDADYLNMPLTWQQPIYVFGFLYIIVTNLGFLQMCKMRAEAEVRQQAMTDGLTGVGNRRALDGALDAELALAARSAQPFSVVMVDIDHFKSINDRFGHRAGDASLAAFAERLRSGLRAQDRAFRYGGEEFCVLLPHTDTAGAKTMAERLHRQVALPDQAGMPAQAASVGVTAWQPGDSADTLLGRADQALYRAKAQGRDRVEIG
ncbi:GGDEF domain-containing protein [Pelomonas sp. KK5]|uniref:GGDEF domain-containing protein n=1 Tax=Pelomonas sp. KK5 TaxID=1855730 RepID=UPI00097BB7E1|nr:GGDEF domain-containing protein [Pelomonas sp. KK5]